MAKKKTTVPETPATETIKVKTTVKKPRATKKKAAAGKAPYEAPIATITVAVIGKDIVREFRGQFDFLSNMYPCLIKGRYTYLSAEAAFQAAKFKDETTKQWFCRFDGYTARRNGKKMVGIDPNWVDKRLDIMYTIVYMKFAQNPGLRAKLLSTGNALLMECNTWGDTFWGVCNGKGENNLGKTLMKVREDLRK